MAPKRAHDDDWVDHASAALRDAGYRSGGARSAVIEILGDSGGCLSAEEVAETARERGRRVGVASVYRALGALSDVGVLHRVSMAGAPVRYELVLPDGEHHHHAVCDSCGDTVSFQDRELEAAIRRLSDRIPYAVGAHEVTLRGLCPHCRGG